MTPEKKHQESERMLAFAAIALSHQPGLVTMDEVREIEACGVSAEEAYRLILAAALGLDPEEETDFMRRYLPRMVCKEHPDTYRKDPYFQVLSGLDARDSNFHFGWAQLEAAELYPRDDLIEEDGLVFPQLGWFPEPYHYPGLWEKERIWMSLTPNEINTIRPLARAAEGQVLCNGLGLGYYAFHALCNPKVTSVTVVEREPALIRLFREAVLPRFPQGKLVLIEDDAFHYIRTGMKEYDTVFTDLWHDVDDGLPLYLRMKEMEYRGPVWQYWIEPTMKCYLKPE